MTDTEMTETMIGAPGAPWCRLVGRVVTPAGVGAGATVTLTPDPCRPTATLADGRVLVASRVVATTDDDGYLAGPEGRWVDVIAPGPGVTPEGEWTYLLTVSVPGRAGSRWERHVVLSQGQVVDLTGLAPQGTYTGDPLTVAEAAAERAAADLAQVRTLVEALVKDRGGDLIEGTWPDRWRSGSGYAWTRTIQEQEDGTRTWVYDGLRDSPAGGDIVLTQPVTLTYATLTMTLPVRVTAGTVKVRAQHDYGPPIVAGPERVLEAGEHTLVETIRLEPQRYTSASYVWLGMQVYGPGRAVLGQPTVTVAQPTLRPLALS